METLVFFPGYLSPPAGFSGFREAFSGYRLLEAEPRPDPLAAADAWAERLPEGAHIVAFSEAAIPAVRLAAEKHAKTLVLFSPVVRRDDALTWRLKALLQALELGGVEAFFTAAAPWFLGSLLLSRGRAQLEAWKAGLENRDLSAWLGAMLDLRDERKWLRTLNLPVLVAVGAEDVFTPMRYGHEVTEWVPELKGMLVTVEGAGHLVPWENPTEAAAVARGFIERREAFLEWPEEEGKAPLRFEPEAPN